MLRWEKELSACTSPTTLRALEKQFANANIKSSGPDRGGERAHGRPVQSVGW